MEKVYETDRLILKTLDRCYAGAVLDYYERNKLFLEEWEAVKSDDFYTLQYHEELLDKEKAGIENNNLLKLWVFKKEDASRVIGCIVFNNIIKGAFLSCHLGYKLDQDELNNGYITEALEKGIQVVFEEYKLHRIEANIMPKNIRSFRVVEKLGFYNEGLAYKYLKINGIWEDHIHMVLLNDKV